MAERTTLFHILSRQPWWVTLLVAFLAYAIARLIHEGVAPFVPIPFVLLAIYIAIKQWRSGGTVNVDETLKQVREMSWDEFSAIVAEAYRRDGYVVAPADGGGYDFTLTKDGRRTLLQCRRWKAGQVGGGPVRELAAAIDKSEAFNGICIAANVFSTPALELARSEPIALVSGAELARLIARGRRGKR
jgi:restriction system protein